MFCFKRKVLTKSKKKLLINQINSKQFESLNVALLLLPISLVTNLVRISGTACITAVGTF